VSQEFRVQFQAASEIVILTMFRLALCPLHLPIQLAQGPLSSREKQPEREADHSPPRSAEIKNV
jgi:hypothetical protein